jgi:hypothetical protein
MIAAQITGDREVVARLQTLPGRIDESLAGILLPRPSLAHELHARKGEARRRVFGARVRLTVEARAAAEAAVAAALAP